MTKRLKKFADFKYLKLLATTAIVVWMLVSHINPMPIKADNPLDYYGGAGLSLSPVIDDETLKSVDCKPIGGGFQDIIRIGLKFATGQNTGGWTPVETLGCDAKNGTASSYLQDYLHSLQQPVLADAPFRAADILYREQPTSGIIYAQQMTDKILHPGRVYAEGAKSYFPGQGTALLGPIRSVWGWSSTFVFSLMILIILGIAFTLLFQNSISGKATIQLTTAIPNIVIAMVLIPLSYPICGFAIDFLAFGSNLVNGVLLSGNTAIAREFYETNELKVRYPGLLGLIPINTGDPASVNKISDVNNRGLYIDDPRISVWRAFSLIDTSQLATIFGIGGGDVKGGVCTNAAIQKLLDDSTNNGDTRAKAILDKIGGSSSTKSIDEIEQAVADVNGKETDPAKKYNLDRSISCTILTLTGSLIEIIQSLTNNKNISLSSIIGDLIYFILSFLAFFTAVRIAVKLFMLYLVNFLILPMVSPFVFASIAIPGQGTKLITWFLKHIYGAALIFIAVYLMFMFAMILSQGNIMGGIPGQGGGAYFVPPLLFGSGASPVVQGTGGTLEQAAGSVSIGLPGLLQLVALGIFFAAPAWIGRLEKALGLEFVLPGVIKDAAAGFGASLSDTARIGGRIASGARTGSAAGYERFKSYYRYREQQRMRGLDQRAMERGGMGAVTESQRTEDAIKKNIREYQYALASIENETGMDAQKEELQKAIAKEQERGKVLLGKEISVTMGKGLNWEFTTTERTAGSDSQIRARVNPGKFEISGSTIVFKPNEGDRMYGVVEVQDPSRSSSSTAGAVFPGDSPIGNDVLRVYATGPTGKASKDDYVEIKFLSPFLPAADTKPVPHRGPWWDFGATGKPPGSNANITITLSKPMSPEETNKVFSLNGQSKEYNYEVFHLRPGQNNPDKYVKKLTVTIAKNIVAGGGGAT